MKTLKFSGPQDYVNTVEGKHVKGEDKEYPDDLARELLEDERFSETGKAAQAKPKARPKKEG